MSKPDPATFAAQLALAAAVGWLAALVIPAHIPLIPAPVARVIAPVVRVIQPVVRAINNPPATATLREVRTWPSNSQSTSPPRKARPPSPEAGGLTRIRTAIRPTNGRSTTPATAITPMSTIGTTGGSATTTTQPPPPTPPTTPPTTPTTIPPSSETTSVPTTTVPDDPLPPLPTLPELSP